MFELEQDVRGCGLRLEDGRPCGRAVGDVPFGVCRAHAVLLAEWVDSESSA